MVGTTLSLIVAAIGFAPRQSPTATFEIVPAPVPLWASEAKAVSADGSTVVGNWNFLGTESCFVWHNGTAPRTVAMPSDVSFFDPSDVNANGTVVVGLAYRHQQEAKAVRWQESGSSGTLQFAAEDEIATGVSSDGTVVSGLRSSSDAQGRPVGSALQFNAGFTSTSLSLPSTETHAGAFDVSADGHVFVGTIGSMAPVRWVDGNLEMLGGLDANHYGAAWATNQDGSVIVGSSRAPADYTKSNGAVEHCMGAEQAFVWKAGAGMRGLGFLPGDGTTAPESQAHSVSADGKIVVGYSNVKQVQVSPTAAEIRRQAFIWDEAHGMRDLRELLVTKYGLGSALQGFELYEAVDISADGKVIVGRADDAQGGHAFVIRLNVRPDEV